MIETVAIIVVYALLVIVLTAIVVAVLGLFTKHRGPWV